MLLEARPGAKVCFFLAAGQLTEEELVLIYQPDGPDVYLQTHHRTVAMALVFKQSVNAQDKLITSPPTPPDTPKEKQGLDGLQHNKKVRILHFLLFKNSALWPHVLDFPGLCVSVGQQSLRPLIPKQNPAISLYMATTKAMSLRLTSKKPQPHSPLIAPLPLFTGNRQLPLSPMQCLK